MIGYLEVECFLYDVHSLKGKRSILKKVISKVRQDYNVSISELKYHDLWQRTVFGIAFVSKERIQIERVLQSVLNTIDSFHDLEVTEYHQEWF
ncbi:DUF503 domain-containing protein [Salirhabdus salicampi]|uniref:DUF503 domain-containing protein n=1 Tax=Salirhabdus salicampi TaxID=476102 RepID=UPI0020C3F30A|nr:DUF503 domain-containing protein [Salirhabdus salicampi]MCP8616481.1 DUF503 family protein [Salirhabdus salicampi]